MKKQTAQIIGKCMLIIAATFMAIALNQMLPPWSPEFLLIVGFIGVVVSFMMFKISA